MPNANDIKFVDLFCGIGGFHIALSKLGAKCVLACDKDKDCRTVYKDNFNMEPQPDVTKLNPEKMPDFNVLCAGFPCQAFSNAGKKKTFDDDRGLLFDEIIRIAKVKQPCFMFLENVKHILKVGDGEVIDYILDKLDKTGYTVQLFNMSPHEYGIPQQRERVYFVCVRKEFAKSDVTLLRDKIPLDRHSFTQFLDDVNTIDPKYFIDGDVEETLNCWEQMVKKFDVGEKISPTIMVNEFYNTYTDDEFKNLANWRQDYITKNKPLYEKYKTQWDDWYQRHKDVISKREIYAKLEWQVGSIKENDSIFDYFIQLRQSGIRVKKSGYFPTLVAISQIPIYGKEKRYITPRECLRLQSFPETYKMSNNDRVTYKQAGNSVNVDNVLNVIESTFKHYNIK